MPKTVYKSADGRFTTEIEYDNLKTLWGKVAEFQEIFEDNNKCCGGPVLFSKRTVDGNDYFEKKCPRCFKKFSYGQHKVGGSLFPNHTKGWHKWERPDGEEPPAQLDAPPKNKR